MRNWIDLFERHDPEFVRIVRAWCNGYDQSAAYDGSNHAEESRIVELAAQHPCRVTGTLFRGQYIDDDLVPRLLKGETVTIAPMKRLIMSWSYSEHTGMSFGEVYADQNQSAVVIALPASSLKPIVDCTEVTGDDYEEEVICLNQPLTISMADVVALWEYDPREERSKRVF